MDKTIKEHMKVFDKNFMVNGISRNSTENINNSRAIISRRNNSVELFSLMAQNGNHSKATTICRTFPLVPLGIQSLNVMLDPAKKSERERKNDEAKEKYNNDFGEMDMFKSYEKLLELLWYTRLPCFDVKGVTSEVEDEMSFVKRCYWRGKMTDCSQIFVTRPTDRGMCCAFNFDNAETVYRNSRFTDSIQKLQTKAKKSSFARISERYIDKTIII